MSDINPDDYRSPIAKAFAVAFRAEDDLRAIRAERDQLARVLAQLREWLETMRENANPQGGGPVSTLRIGASSAYSATLAELDRLTRHAEEAEKS